MLPRPVPDAPGPGRDSVWSYPRPAVLRPAGRALKVVFAGRTVAETERGLAVLETSHPPTYYFPLEDVARGFLRPAAGDGSLCEWKGQARYFDLVAGDAVVPRAAWSYPNPEPAFRRIRDWFAFYAGPDLECSVDGERARPQEGNFYGGWITPWVAGPFKGGPGTRFW